jgi:hypothetical protein
MRRLCTDSSCSYSGRSAQQAVSVAMGVGLRGHSKRDGITTEPTVPREPRVVATPSVIGQKSAEATVVSLPGYEGRTL